MENMNNDINNIHTEVISNEEFQKKMQKDLRELHEKYNELNEQIQDLQNDKADFKISIKTMSDNFTEVSKNVQDILSKIDNINNRENGREVRYENEEGTMKKMVCKPLKKLAVGTVGSILSITDKVVEVSFGVKEGFEDIVAEAQYQRKKKHLTTMDE
jgi:chromosome segregation ATPase